MTEFEGVVSALAQALSKRGYTEFTPVQHAVLAPELEGADTLVSAQTGSGKTMAFGMAIARCCWKVQNVLLMPKPRSDWLSHRPGNWPCRLSVNWRGCMK